MIQQRGGDERILNTQKRVFCKRHCMLKMLLRRLQGMYVEWMGRPYRVNEAEWKTELVRIDDRASEKERDREREASGRKKLVRRKKYRKHKERR